MQKITSKGFLLLFASTIIVILLLIFQLFKISSSGEELTNQINKLDNKLESTVQILSNAESNIDSLNLIIAQYNSSLSLLQHERDSLIFSLKQSLSANRKLLNTQIELNNKNTERINNLLLRNKEFK